MDLLFRITLSYLLFASAASAASLLESKILPLHDAAADAPTELTLSSGELSAGCTSGLCRSGGRIAPADDPVFQFANTAATPAAVPVVVPESGARNADGPVPAGIGSVPEPQTYALLCSGLVLLGGLARRRPRP